MLYKPFQIALGFAINATPPTLWEGVFVFGICPAVISWMWSTYGPRRLPGWQDVVDIFNFFNQNWIIAGFIFGPVQEALVNYFLNIFAGAHKNSVKLKVVHRRLIGSVHKITLFCKIVAAIAAFGYRPAEMFINYYVFAEESSNWEIVFLFFLYQWPLALLILHIVYRQEPHYGAFEFIANLGMHSCFVVMLYKPFQIALGFAINATPPTLWEGVFVFGICPAVISWMWSTYGPRRLPGWQDVVDIFNFFNQNWIIAGFIFGPVQEALVNYFLNIFAGAHKNVMWMLLRIFFLVVVANFIEWCRQSPPMSRIAVFVFVLIAVLVQGAVFASKG
ncbi:hypothetical protein Ahy_A07g037330 isoform E [Arachis hypogaea]|nr:hypothetical protein Ahy_A07g037330 isoform E [Arachis hypogaea]